MGQPISWLFPAVFVFMFVVLPPRYSNTPAEIVPRFSVILLYYSTGNVVVIISVFAMWLFWYVTGVKKNCIKQDACAAHSILLRCPSSSVVESRMYFLHVVFNSVPSFCFRQPCSASRLVLFFLNIQALRLDASMASPDQTHLWGVRKTGRTDLSKKNEIRTYETKATHKNEQYCLRGTHTRRSYDDEVTWNNKIRTNLM